MFETKKEEEIIKLAQNGKEDAIKYLIKNNMDIVYHEAKFFFINGQEREDVIQEGRIGLYEAISNYKIKGNSSFRSFCDLCVYRQLVSAITSANRNKHFYLNHSTSMDKSFFDNDNSEASLNNIIPDKTENIEKNFLTKELFKHLFTELKENLTELEWRVFKHYLEDKSYKKISETIEVDTKCVDNALQRVRKKIEEIKSDYEGKVLMDLSP
ncbi:MAG: sigma-70 family RNA polymerase sigma factor [bacterium]